MPMEQLILKLVNALQVRVIPGNALIVLFITMFYFGMGRIHATRSSENGQLLKWLSVGWLINFVYLIIEISISMLDVCSDEPFAWPLQLNHSILPKIALSISTFGSVPQFAAGLIFLHFPALHSRTRTVLVPTFVGALVFSAALLCSTGILFSAIAVILVAFNALAVLVMATSIKKMITPDLMSSEPFVTLVKCCVILPLYIYAVLQFGYLSVVGFYVEDKTKGLVVGGCFLIASLTKLVHLFGIGGYAWIRGYRLQRSEQKEKELQMKQAFLAEMAHELGTPDLSLNLLLDRLEQLVKAQSPVAQVAKQMRNSTEILMALINGAQYLFNSEFQQLCSDTIPVPFVRCSVNDLVQAALLEVKGALSTHKNYIPSRVKTTLTLSRNMEVFAQRVRLVQVFINIINNSYESLAENADDNAVQVIEISTRREIDHRAKSIAVIEIADNGRGIPATLLTQLLHNTVSSKGLNRGKGLYLSNRYIEDQGGTIKFESPVGRWNRGAKVTITLPIAPLT